MATETWRHEFDVTYRRMVRLMEGLGDPTRERLFRMNITLCLHRVASDAEVAALPPHFKQDTPGLAGGPIEILWSKGLETSLSCQPCANPTRRVLEPSRPDLWVPDPCGKCPSCLARAACAIGTEK